MVLDSGSPTEIGRVVLLFLGICLSLAAPGCRLAQKRGFHVDLMRLEDPQDFVDDVLVWPVADSTGGLDDALCDRLTRKLGQEMIEREYSVLNAELIGKKARQYGVGEASARRVVDELDSDSALVVRVTEWDESGLAHLGRVRVTLGFKLIGRAGRVLWTGRMIGRDIVIDSLAAPRTIKERRRIAVDRIARELVGKLPWHRV
ncbi:MAG: hypothetical protein ACE5F1_19390 [Planctomycetota bacterium]